MRDSASSPVPAQGTRTAEALVHLQHVVVDGLRHGFFECSVTCEIVSSGKRQLVIRSGKSHRFLIPRDELQR